MSKKSLESGEFYAAGGMLSVYFEQKSDSGEPDPALWVSSCLELASGTVCRYITQTTINTRLCVVLEIPTGVEGTHHFVACDDEDADLLQ